MLVKFTWTHTNRCSACAASDAQQLHVYEKRGDKYHKVLEFQLTESPAEFNPTGHKLKIKPGDGKLEVVCFGDCGHKAEATF